MTVLAKNMYQLAKPGGKFLSINGGFEEGANLERLKDGKLDKYGVKFLSDLRKLYDFMPFKARIKIEELGIDVDFNTKRISTTLYRKVLEKVGFQDVKITRINFTGNETEEVRNQFQDYVNYTEDFIMTGTKPLST